MQTSAKSSTGHDTIDPGYDTDDHQFTYRHPKPDSRRSAPSMPTMLMGILATMNNFA
jgi:hypothetical protein